MDVSWLGSSSAASSSINYHGMNQVEQQRHEFARVERNNRRREQRIQLLEKWYKQMRYVDLKKVLIRLKSRKFLTSECTICLQPIQNESICRMLNCYHIFHSECIDQWFSDRANCPICKKTFGPGVVKKYNLEEFV